MEVGAVIAIDRVVHARAAEGDSRREGPDSRAASQPAGNPLAAERVADAHRRQHEDDEGMVDRYMNLLKPSQQIAFLTWIEDNQACMYMLNSIWMNRLPQNTQKWLVCWICLDGVLKARFPFGLIDNKQL